MKKIKTNLSEVIMQCENEDCITSVVCHVRADAKHHLFSNTKTNRKLYCELMDDDKNIMFIKNSCHITKSIPKLTEKEFCDKLGIKTRSKSMQYKNFDFGRS